MVLAVKYCFGRRRQSYCNLFNYNEMREQHYQHKHNTSVMWLKRLSSPPSSEEDGEEDWQREAQQLVT